MPYIEPKDRGFVLVLGAKSPGELNYVLTHEINKYLRANELSYQTINDVLGALEGAKLEFYRRVAAPYEDQKIKENGDVYDV